MANEISVDLRLKMEKLAQDASKAGKVVSSNLASSVKGLGETSVEREDRGAIERKEREKRERAIRNRKLDEADAARERQEAQRTALVRMAIMRNSSALEQRQQAESKRAVLWRMGVMRNSSNMESDAEKKKQADAQRAMLWRLNVMRNSSALEERTTAQQKKLFEKNNPIPTPAQPKKLNPTGLLAGLGLGIPGLGAIASLASINPAAAALTTAFRLLKFEAEMVWKNFRKASEEARRMYAKSLQSGLGLQLTAKRSVLADIIGVGEEEVWQYGAAVAALNDRISSAAKVLADTNRTLTSSAWNIKILKLDMEAFGAKLAVEVAPAVNLIVNALDGLVKLVSRNINTLKLIAKIGAGAFPGSGMETLFQAASMAGKIGDAAGVQAPPPVSYMKRMPASSWERMGLVIGQSGGTNYSQQTAKNTAKAVELLQTIAAKVATNLGANSAGISLPSLP